jgi:uncharacterized protein YgiM (DUF1202 family)
MLKAVKMKTKLLIIFLATLLLLSGCSLFSPIEAEATQIPTLPPAPPTIQPPTFTPSSTQTPAETATPALTATPLVTPSPVPFVPFTVTVAVDNVNLRNNPGYLFSVLRILHINDTVLVLGKSLGDEWFLVQTNSFVTGWVFGKLIQTDERLNLAPVFQPSDAQLITGKVVNEQGIPISGLQFAFVQGEGSNAPRNDAVTNVDGIFYAFMPLNISGVWTVSYVAIACTSNVMDADCNNIPGMGTNVDPSTIQITLPANQSLNFIWK